MANGEDALQVTGIISRKEIPSKIGIGVCQSRFPDGVLNGLLERDKSRS